jgi:cytochrome c oxidase cbb3-type subunit 3
MLSKSKTIFPFLILFFSGISLPTIVHAAPDGKDLYREHCEACHQIDGEGGIGLPLSTIKLRHVSNAYLEKTIRMGRPGRIMPAYRELSDAQVQAIIGYMRSWSDDPLPEFPSDKIAGDVVNGEKIYKKRCAKCHADDGSGEGKGTGVTHSRKRQFMVMPAAINNPGYQESVSDAEIREIIIADREDSKMPSMHGKLEDQEINDLVAYVRSMERSVPAFEESEFGRDLAIIVESPSDFPSTVAAVREALKAANFRLFPERYLEEGLIDEFSHNTKQVSLRFCNFGTLYDMMRIEPRLGIILPCRITITQMEDGRVLLIAPNIREMASWFNNDELLSMAVEMEETINTIIEESTF